MTLNGHLAEFSLPEIFQLLEQGHKTGLLTIQTGLFATESLTAAQMQTVLVRYIWLKAGRIVAVAERLDDKGLVSLIAQRCLSERFVSQVAQSCPPDTPLGLCLKSEGLLHAEQLQRLFLTQVVEQVSALLEFRDGHFKFEPKATMPLAEMTGLSLPATEATIMGLRKLRDWTALAEKLPDPTSALSKLGGQPRLKLDAAEWQVWELANGTISLQHLAAQLRLPVKQVQQIAFRLLILNLVEEVFIIAAPPTSVLSESSPAANTLPQPRLESSSPAHVSQSFLQNLVGFLQGKAWQRQTTRN